MLIEPRLQAILQVVDELIRRLNHWNDSSAPILPASVELAIQQADIVLSDGEPPPSCLALGTAVSRLVEELRSYNAREHGKVRPESGAPGPAFWAAAKAVLNARDSAQSLLTEPLEPVAVLLSQGVSCDQIARHIYGRGGIGPFVRANGTPDVALIEQESREPGSVIKPDWIPPWHSEKFAAKRRVLAAQLQAFDRRQSDLRYDDPATVEELLREGAFVQQIERAKGVSREQVLETAKRIGVTAVDGPGFQPTVRSLFESDILIDDDDDDDDDDVTPPAADRAAMKALAIELYTKSRRTRGAADIAAELRKLGHDVNTKTVAGIIGGWKKKHAMKPSESK